MAASEGATRLERLVRTIEGDARARERAPDATLRRGDLSPSDAPKSATAPFLPPITLDERAPDAGAPDAAPADLVISRLLGAGGMGVVHEAAQRSLDRAVAIKRPNEGIGGAALVEEARVMARVEHPSVVPVHALGRDSTDRPVLVMKRVQGVVLRELLRNAESPHWAPLLARWGDRERAAIGILGDVADALALAHARGVVHRDVKPENVMVGEFGEVYLLDWGIALAMDRRDRHATEIVGTPGYMAPEMVLEPETADARTDVYLLGATLHEVLTGTVRHRAETMAATLLRASESEPIVYGPEVPEDLAALANWATRRDCADRPADAVAFRRALAEHERHREALALVRGAREVVAPITERALALDDAAAAPLLADASAVLAAASRAHPESRVVRTARAEVLRLSVERDLALRSPAAARASLAQLRALGEPIEGDLEARIAAAERALERAAASEDALRRAREDADTRAALRTRLWLYAGIFLPIVVVAILVSLVELPSGEALTMRRVLVTDLVVMALLSAGVWSRRATLLANRGNRTLSAYALAGVAILTTANVVSMVLGHDAPVAMPHAHAAMAGYFLVGAIVLSRAFAWGIVSSLVGVATIIAWPEWTAITSPLTMSASLLAGAIGVWHQARKGGIGV